MLFAFVLVVLVFSLARPSTFPTWTNAKEILANAAPQMIIALGLTVVLVMQDFDLSVGSMASLAGGAAVAEMTMHGMAWEVALVLAAGLGIAAGIAKGYLVAVLRGNSFIMTLAMGTILTGVEFAFTSDITIFQPVSGSFVSIASQTILGINNEVWFALGVALVLWLLLDATEAGRYMYAIGGNQEAARLSGIRVRTLRVIGFGRLADGGAGRDPDRLQRRRQLHPELRHLPAAAGLRRRLPRRRLLPAGRVQHPGHRGGRGAAADDLDRAHVPQPPDLPDQPRAGGDPDHRGAGQHGRDAPHMSPREPFLVATGLVKRYPGVVALDHAHLEVFPGVVTGLLGKNGAGKSTLIKILAGAVAADAGELRIDGRAVTLSGPHDATTRGLRFIHQELTDVPSMTVAENIELGLGYPKRLGFLLNRRALRRRAAQALEPLGARTDPAAKLGSLSVAQRRLVVIARGLVTNARLLVLDEPTASLSDEEVSHLHDVVRLLRDRGVAVIYVTHRLQEVAAVTDEVIVMRDGHMVFEGATAEVDRGELIGHITGGQLEAGTVERWRPPRPAAEREELLRVEALTLPGVVESASFTLRAAICSASPGWSAPGARSSCG